MKVLVTDFDGTICNPHSDDIDVKANVEALNRFKHENNIIIVSTARAPESIMKYIDMYNIPCDYVISYMGALIWDCKAKEYIYANYFSGEIAKKILKMVEPYLSDCELKIYSIVENPRIDQQIGYFFYNEEGDKNDVFYRMTKDFGRTIESIIDEDYKSYDFFTRFFSEQEYFINNTKNNKLIPLEFLLDYLKKKKIIDDDTPIYTIGDTLDDFEMLKKFNGYRMEKSDDRLVNRYSKKVESVKTYIDMILAENKN